MTTAFVDTCAWAKRYVPEPESERFESWFCAHTPLTVSELARVEMASLLHKMARAERLGHGGVADVLRLVDRDVSEGFVVIQPWPAQIFDHACGLVAGNSQFGLRSLDALQLACALVSGCRQFATADRKLALAARANDLDVVWFGPREL